MKKKYIITYDLNKPGQDYETLIDAIKTYDYINAMKSTWFIRTSLSASDIRDHLNPLIDSSDSIFISEITQNWACWLKKAVIDWLNKD
jgi:hypothetical protein